MGTKMKGLLKGLRYISQIFDDEKEQEIQIGYPTDVKHVAHIGWDGPSVDSPSWMKEFKSPSQYQSAPLGIAGEPEENPEVKWVSEDSKSSRASDSPRDLPELPKSYRNASCSIEKSESPKKESSRRHSRRNQSKESGENSVRSTRQQQSELESGSSVPDIPKKTRRKKSKENVGIGSSSSSKSSRSKDTGGSLKPRKVEVSQNSSLKNHTIPEGG